MEGPKIKKIEMEPGETNIIFQYPGIVDFVNTVVEFFKEAGGVNYVGFSACHEREGEFDIIIQKKYGKSMYEINSELKKEIKEFKKLLKSKDK